MSIPTQTRRCHNSILSPTRNILKVSSIGKLIINLFEKILVSNAIISVVLPMVMNKVSAI